MQNGRIAVVTGGGRGIGAAVSEKLAAMGFSVYITCVSRSEVALEAAERIVAAGGMAQVMLFDVSDSEKTKKALSVIIEREGQIDVLVNNAGITRDGLLVKMKEESWDAVLNTNLKGAFNCTQAVSRIMMKQRLGKIINISSVIGFSGNAGQVNYAAAKAGLIGLTKSVARELASRNVTVNAVAPGFIETEMTAGLSSEMRDKVLSEIPLARLGQTKDVADAVAYLVEADYVTGQTIHVNGGMYM